MIIGKKLGTGCGIKERKLLHIQVSLYSVGRRSCKSNSIFTSGSLMLKLQWLQKTYFSVPELSVCSGLNNAFFFPFFPEKVTG